MRGGLNGNRLSFCLLRSRPLQQKIKYVSTTIATMTAAMAATYSCYKYFDDGLDPQQAFSKGKMTNTVTAVTTTKILKSSFNTWYPIFFPTTKCDSSAPFNPDGSPGQEEIREEKMYANLFPQKLLYVPRVEYPQWDPNWDERNSSHSLDPNKNLQSKPKSSNSGVTRHIILIRHGQYDETSSDDALRILTPLGREQAHQTGIRLRHILMSTNWYQGSNQMNSTSNTTSAATTDTATPANHLFHLHVSQLTRAKETADILMEHLGGIVKRTEPDSLLNEVRPCPHIPSGGKITSSSSACAKLEKGTAQVQDAFDKYFYRAYAPTLLSSSSSACSQNGDDSEISQIKKQQPHQHEFEIIVGHANVIRYFVCRALQLPPEAWLRFCNFNCSITYLVIRPSGTVSCRMFGDTGHLNYPQQTTFSQHIGYEW
jgi:serine/threonine-protein phosphatase PGAM5